MVDHTWLIEVLCNVRQYAEYHRMHALLPLIEAACEATEKEMEPKDIALTLAQGEADAFGLASSHSRNAAVRASQPSLRVVTATRPSQSCS